MDKAHHNPLLASGRDRGIAARYQARADLPTPARADLSNRP